MSRTYFFTIYIYIYIYLYIYMGIYISHSNGGNIISFLTSVFHFSSTYAV